MNSDEKNCPKCGGVIKAVAVKCKHCKSFLSNESKMQSLSNELNRKPSEGKTVNKNLIQKWIPRVSIITVLTLIAVYLSQQKMNRDIFGNQNIDCNNKQVVATVKKVIQKQTKYSSVITGISTEEKEDEYRSCFALITIKELNLDEVQLQYEVRRTDDKKSFTVMVYPVYNFNYYFDKLMNMGD